MKLTDSTAMELAEAALDDKDHACLMFARSMFLTGHLSLDDLGRYITGCLGFSEEAAIEYLNSCGDAEDGDYAEPSPAVQAAVNARLAPPEPVERPRRILRPNYGPRTAQPPQEPRDVS
jgi:hypothetical protein